MNFGIRICGGFGIILFLLIAPLLLTGNPVHASTKSGDMLNPISDVSWGEIFPIKIGGRSMGGGSNYDNYDTHSGATCQCPMPPPVYRRYGITFSMWEPARMIETVATPWYFPFLGDKFDSDDSGGGGAHKSSYKSGKNAEMNNAAQEMSTFAQAHKWIFPVWAILGLIVDSKCIDSGGMDIAYLTELDSLWQDDEFNAVINPEAMVFGNYFAQLSCIADAVATNIIMPLDPLFWCLGSGGSSYPMTGHVSNENMVQANSTIAARLIYKLSRQGLTCDTGVYVCFCVPAPIWRKSNYKMHAMRPAVRTKAYPLGKSALFYGTLLDPPYRGAKGAGNEYLWMVFRKHLCCSS